MFRYTGLYRRPHDDGRITMSNKKAVQKQFGRSADAYVESEGHRKGKDLEKLIALAAITGDETALDVATGGGHTANALAPLVRRVVALDLTPEMLAAAKAFIEGNGHDNVDFVQGDAEAMPFPDGSFDIVACRIAPHHFPHVERFIAEVHRVLKPGGQFLLDDNVAPEDDESDAFYNTLEKKRDYSHYRAWKKSEWLRMLEAHGFIVQEWHRFEKTFRFDAWCDRMKLPKAEKEALNEWIGQAPDPIKRAFRIEIKDNRVVSFQGEAMIAKAVKRG